MSCRIHLINGARFISPGCGLLHPAESLTLLLLNLRIVMRLSVSPDLPTFLDLDPSPAFAFFFSLNFSALTMRSLFDRYPGMRQILTDLRYEVRLDKCPGLGELQFVTVSSCLPSFRPADEFLLMATRFSGAPAFIELVDTEAVPALQDPLRSRLEQFLR